ncbi:hypothetical protein NSTC731_06457 [Nostoc sp. DSM 114167]
MRSQPANQRGGASLSDRALAQIVEKLEQFQPQVIGLDIYRENHVEPEYKKLSKFMQKSDRFFAICKVSEENKNSGDINIIHSDLHSAMEYEMLKIAPRKP